MHDAYLQLEGLILYFSNSGKDEESGVMVASIFVMQVWTPRFVQF
jgi:hypothetical protein